LKNLFNSFGNEAHFIKIGVPNFIGECVEFSLMLLGNNDAIALIKLPLPQQHKTVGEVPNKFFRGNRRKGGKFLAKKTVGQREKS
jgi:hypothetical protein